MVNKLTILYVLEPFLTCLKQPLHLAEVSKQLRLSHPTVRKHLNFLEEKGLLKKEIKGRLTLYSLNLNTQNLLDYLTIAEKDRLIKRCEEEKVLAELVKFLAKRLTESNKAVIFGSATVSAKKAHDIDLLISGNFDRKTLDAFAERYNLDIHLISVKHLKEVSEALRIEIGKKHLAVYGSEAVLRWLLL